MLNPLQKSPEQLEALAQVREWTRVRFSLPEDAAILVSEVACGLPGCPPVETMVVFWTADATRHQFKIFKSVQAVAAPDLPYAWLKDALAVPEGFEYDCC
jgi:nitrate reductase delta subunit